MTSYVFFVGKIGTCYIIYILRHIHRNHIPAGWAENREKFSKFKNVIHVPALSGKPGWLLQPLLCLHCRTTLDADKNWLSLLPKETNLNSKLCIHTLDYRRPICDSPGLNRASSSASSSAASFASISMGLSLGILETDGS